MIWMLGKVPLVKGFHVIFTKFHDYVLHIRAPQYLQSVPELQQTRLWALLYFHGYLQFLCFGLTVCYWKPFRRSVLNSLLKIQTYIQLQREGEGGLCSNIRTVATDVDPCRGEIKKKGMHFRSPIVRWGGEISNKMQPWHFQANYDLKKYSYVTCRGEQSPSKFDTYSRQVKSMFGCEADLNTLTAHQLKSTFSAKRLT